VPLLATGVLMAIILCSTSRGGSSSWLESPLQHSCNTSECAINIRFTMVTVIVLPCTARSGCQRSPSSPVERIQSKSTQAFLLLVFSNAHDKITLLGYAAAVDKFAGLIDRLVPSSTRMVWASRHCGDLSKMAHGELQAGKRTRDKSDSVDHRSQSDSPDIV